MSFPLEKKANVKKFELFDGIQVPARKDSVFKEWGLLLGWSLIVLNSQSLGLISNSWVEMLLLYLVLKS
jgi:hypothetical protein